MLFGNSVQLRLPIGFEFPAYTSPEPFFLYYINRLLVCLSGKDLTPDPTLVDLRKHPRFRRATRSIMHAGNLSAFPRGNRLISS